MSNDDIVMANYSMLLEVYFLFMDINLSLSGISLALLCERRDLQEEACCWDVRGWDARAIGRTFYHCKGNRGGGVCCICFVFCFYSMKDHFLRLKALFCLQRAHVDHRVKQSPNSYYSSLRSQGGT